MESVSEASDDVTDWQYEVESYRKEERSDEDEEDRRNLHYLTSHEILLLNIIPAFNRAMEEPVDNDRYRLVRNRTLLKKVYEYCAEARKNYYKELQLQQQQQRKGSDATTTKSSSSSASSTTKARRRRADEEAARKAREEEQNRQHYLTQMLLSKIKRTPGFFYKIQKPVPTNLMNDDDNDGEDDNEASAGDQMSGASDNNNNNNNNKNIKRKIVKIEPYKVPSFSLTRRCGYDWYYLNDRKYTSAFTTSAIFGNNRVKKFDWQE